MQSLKKFILHESLLRMPIKNVFDNKKGVKKKEGVDARSKK